MAYFSPFRELPEFPETGLPDFLELAGGWITP
jgi:hypothetical protein